MMDVLECIGTKCSNAFEGNREGWTVLAPLKREQCLRVFSFVQNPVEVVGESPAMGKFSWRSQTLGLSFSWLKKDDSFKSTSTCQEWKCFA